MRRSALLAGMAGAVMLAGTARAQPAPRHDEFFWIGEINKASTVINSQTGLLDPALAPRIAAGLDSVLRAGDAPGGKWPS